MAASLVEFITFQLTSQSISLLHDTKVCINFNNVAFLSVFQIVDRKHLLFIKVYHLSLFFYVK